MFLFKNLNNVPLAVILPVPLTVTRPGNIKHAGILAIINPIRMDPLFLRSTRCSKNMFQYVLMLDSYFFSALPDWIFSIKALLFTLILPASHTCVANQDKISTILGTIFNTFVVHQNREYSFWQRIYLRSASLPPIP